MYLSFLLVRFKSLYIHKNVYFDISAAGWLQMTCCLHKRVYRRLAWLSLATLIPEKREVHSESRRAQTTKAEVASSLRSNNNNNNNHPRPCSLSANFCIVFFSSFIISHSNVLYCLPTDANTKELKEKV